MQGRAAEAGRGLSLTAAQHGIWLGQALDPRSPAYVAAEYVALAGPVNIAALHAALEQALSEVDALHVRFELGPDAPRQVPVARVVSLPVIDLSHAQGGRARAEETMREDLARPFDLSQGPLFRGAIFRLSSEQALIYLAAHHIALDGFGFSLVFERAAQVYGARCAGRAAEPARFSPLAAVVEEDARYQASAESENDRAFWLRALSARARPVTIAAGSALASDCALRAPLALGDARFARVKEVARALDVSWAELLIATFALQFARETGAREALFGLPVTGRVGSTALRAPCMLMNIVPLALELGPDLSLTSCARAVREHLRVLRPHARCRYEQLRRTLGGSFRERRLFGPVINVIPFDHAPRFAALHAATHNLSAGPVEDLALSLYAQSGARAPHVFFDANPARYQQRELDRLARGFASLLARVLEEPALALAQLTADAGAPSTRFAEAWLEGEALAAPAEDVIAQCWAHVLARPEASALEQGDEACSYTRLFHGARKLAQHLVELGVGAESVVAIHLPRGREAVEAILAVLLAGGAYLPLDPEGPSGRLGAILVDAQPSAIITRPQDRARFAAFGAARIVFSGDARDTQPLARPVPASREQLAYLMYTSGSTGVPNGVMISRGALAHFVAAARQCYGFEGRDRVLQFAPLHFDASVEEIFATLSSGATLIVRDAQMLESFSEFVAACAAREISVLDLPTAYFHELAYALSESNLRLPSCLRCVIIGGEAASAERVARFRRSMPAGARLFNSYGPTEATVVALAHELRDAPGAPEDAVPIGRPLHGIGALVIADDGLPARLGEVGELYLTGPCLARGYLARSQRTAERFVTLAQHPARPRAYRTGDRVQRRADGALSFVGRRDDQLKISGQRLDLQEIEATLFACAGVREVAVIAQKHGDAHVLTAYVVSDAPELDVGALRDHARSRLLPAAVPARFVRSERLPRTASGKIDRAELARLPTEVRASTEADSDLARAILAVFREVLGRPELGAGDDFFEQGGQSLQLIQATNRLSLALAREISAKTVLAQPSATALAAVLEGRAEPVASSPRAQMLADATLLADLVPARARGAEGAPRQVLLTGATGFVGAQLLRALLDTSGLRVVCLVRAADDAAARERLRQALTRQGLSLEGLAERVLALPSDLTRPRLGLSELAFRRFAAECDAVYHNAASVSLVRGYGSMRAINVLASAEALRFAGTARVKPIHFVSTLAVAAGAWPDGVLREQFAPPHDGLADGYTQTKWTAEELVRVAIARGVPAKVYRLGRIVGAAESAYVNAEDIVFRLLRASLRVGVTPAFEFAEPWTPVDALARAIVRIAASGAAAGVYHVAAREQVSLSALFTALRAFGYPLEPADSSVFLARLALARDEDAQATRAFFERQGALSAPPSFTVQSERAARVLGDFAWPRVDRTLLHRYFETCVRAGHFPPPGSARCESHPSTRERS